MPCLLVSLLLAVVLPSQLTIAVSPVARGDDPSPLEAMVQQQGQLIQQLQATLDAFQTQTQTFETETQGRLTTVENKLAKQAIEVGFNARLVSDGTDNITANSNIVFGRVDLNTGNGFDRYSGMFTAPVSGLYSFTLHIGHTPPGRIHAQLWKEGVVIMEVEASGDDHYSDRASNTVTVHLNKAQRVWPVSRETTSSKIQGAFRSSFTGVLVHVDP